MRTRLDEIVDEETRPYGAGPFLRHNVAALATRIAERAFRHGVEQAKDGMVTTQCWPETVQPAPAEEKYEYWQHDPVKCVLRSTHEGECTRDRRKGERRKGLEQSCQCCSGAHYRHRGDRAGEFGYSNRRSRKDRRRG